MTQKRRRKRRGEREEEGREESGGGKNLSPVSIVLYRADTEATSTDIA